MLVMPFIELSISPHSAIAFCSGEHDGYAVARPNVLQYRFTHYVDLLGVTHLAAAN